jgi:hypothetical protein
MYLNNRPNRTQRNLTTAALGTAVGGTAGVLGTAGVIKARGNPDALRRKDEAYQNYIDNSSDDDRAGDIIPFAPKSKLYQQYKDASNRAADSAGINPALLPVGGALLGGGAALLRARRNASFRYMN